MSQILVQARNVQEEANKGSVSEASSRGDAASEAPEEKLAFALSDGRVGVLSVSGRKVGNPSFNS